MSSEEEIKQTQEIEVENNLKKVIQEKPELLQKIITDLEHDPKSRLAFKQMKIHSGPLPDPLTLKEYGKVYKNAPQDIVKMAQKEQNFRHISTYFGQFSALAIGMGGLAVTAYLGVNNQPWLAGIIGFGSLSTLVGTFLYNSKKPNK
ncbi:DUF2335 domain-containing protein [Malaciobacter marinus]|jgi:uncharacterized membrane protein|uniref:DUF2335 domain-containing protein n=1 Tax=Malaciobacter marinus TaxID=505249 RepID=UPI0009A709A6|nr:DUF2335 domain-containing protein [Malaciobacter marinus]SKB59520.1 Predicted membrane protein [Malaciobacter marinus]